MPFLVDAFGSWAVAAEVWERIKLGGRSLALSLQSVWATIEAGWLTALSGIQRSWADFLHAATRSLDGVPGMESTMPTLSEAAIRAGSAFYETARPAPAPMGLPPPPRSLPAPPQRRSPRCRRCATR